MIELANSVFVVDGETELEAIKKRILNDKSCRVEMRKGIGNGRDVDVPTYARLLAALLLPLLADRFEHIVVVMDREKRKIPPSSLAEQIVSETILALKRLDKTVKGDEVEAKLCVFVSDIMFENWIVADVTTLSLKYPDLIVPGAVQGMFDGTHGVGKLNSFMKDRNYKKTIHGPKFFLNIDLDLARRNSPSLDTFVGAVY